MIIKNSLSLIIATAFSMLTPQVFAKEYISLYEIQDSKQAATEYSLDYIKKAPEILSLVDSSSRTNESFSHFDPVNVCSNCYKTARSIKYETCNDKNDYLNSSLNQLGRTSPLLSVLKNSTTANSTINPECIRTSLFSTFSSKAKSFKQCESQGSLKNYRFKNRPCINESYFNVINNSFSLVGQCLKGFLSNNSAQADQDILSIFSLINIESGFHLNAVSGTGAGGIGQFTSGAIDDFNENQLPNVRKQLSESSNPRCQQMSDEILNGDTPMRASSSLSCNRVSMKNGNPLLNMIYTFGYFKQTKSYLQKGLLNNHRYKHYFSTLPAPEKLKLERALAVWAHNTGAAGVVAPAATLLLKEYSDSKVVDVDEFIEQLAEKMKSSPARANRSVARRNETSTYFLKAKKHLQNIEENVRGGTCLKQ